MATLLVTANAALFAQLWDVIPPADMSKIPLDSFADEDLDMPYHVAHFHALATAVERDGTKRGFIIAPVWRSVEENQPHNARVMENIIALAYFYSQKKPWNPFYGSAQVRFRLEAALAYWVALQGPDGAFAESGEKEWSLSATASATKFMAQTLHYLKDGPPLNDDLLRRTVEANRKAIIAVLYGAEFYEQGRHFSSDYSSVWAGALAHLALYPDPEIRHTLETRLRASITEFQSPLGYFYEADGPDMGYNLRTHHSNIRMAWHYSKGTPYEAIFTNKMKDFYVWLVWNASLEKENAGYYVNCSVNTRTNKCYLPLDAGMPHQNGTPLAESVRLARAFALDETARQNWLKQRRKELERAWPNLPELALGDPEGYSPYTFLHRTHSDWAASRELFQEVLTALPCTDKKPFNHIKQSNRENLLFYYANRPGAYYAAFGAGQAVRPQQSLGLTLIRAHGDGTVLLAQPGNANLAWGTRPAKSEDVYESTRIAPGFVADNMTIQVKEGPNSLPEGDVVLSYAIGVGKKTITLRKDRIDVEIVHPGEFTEQIPVVVPDDKSVDSKRESTSAGKMRIEHPTAGATVGEAVDLEGPRKLVPVVLSGRENLRYTLRF